MFKVEVSMTEICQLLLLKVVTGTSLNKQQNQILTTGPHFARSWKYPHLDSNYESKWSSRDLRSRCCRTTAAAPARKTSGLRARAADTDWIPVYLPVTSSTDNIVTVDELEQFVLLGDNPTHISLCCDHTHE